MEWLGFLVFFMFTDHSIGLSLKQRSYACGDQTYYTEDNGTVVSHSGYHDDRYYGKALDCMWTIEAPVGWNVQLIAEDFSVQYDSACRYDYVELFDGNGTSSPSLGRFCSYQFAPISSTQHILTIVFVTDGRIADDGFKFHYNFTKEVIRRCPANKWMCNNGKCIIALFQCDDEDDCGDDSDETDCHDANE